MKIFGSTTHTRTHMNIAERGWVWCKQREIESEMEWNKPENNDWSTVFMPDKWRHGKDGYAFMLCCVFAETDRSQLCCGRLWRCEWSSIFTWFLHPQTSAKHFLLSSRMKHNRCQFANWHWHTVCCCCLCMYLSAMCMFLRK